MQARAQAATASTTTDPRAVAAVREWRATLDALVPLKAAAAQAGRLAEKERKARYAVGELLGESTALEVDGEVITYDRGARGGGDPDYQTAWQALYEEMPPEWRAHMIMLLEANRTPAAPAHKLTVLAAVNAPVVEAPHPAPVPRRSRRPKLL